jgi:hypothetical protein
MEQGTLMTWTSDNTAMLLYSIFGTLMVLAWVYVPA